MSADNGFSSSQNNLISMCTNYSDSSCLYPAKVMTEYSNDISCWNNHKNAKRWEQFVASSLVADNELTKVILISKIQSWV